MAARQEEPGPGPPAGTPTTVAAEPHRLWEELLERTARSGPSVWVRDFTLDTLEPDGDVLRGVLRPEPEDAAARRRANPDRLHRLAERLSQLAGRSVRLVLSPPPAGAADQRTARVRPADTRMHQSDALQVPLVQDIFDIFPDADIVDFHRETPEEPG